MATVVATQRLSIGAIQVKLASPNGAVARDMLRRGLRVETAAKRNLGGGTGTGPKRVDTGRLRASINTNLVMVGGKPCAAVGTNVWYARMVHDGTGLYGPRRRWITPVRRRVLRFKPARRGKWVYAKRVRGMQGNPFLVGALWAARG